MSANKVQKKISFELNIRGVRINLPDQTSVTIYWARGNTKMEDLSITRWQEDRHQDKTDNEYEGYF